MSTISVIIPIFNAEKFLPDLFAALDQCAFCAGDEVLLVDNGSTDHSAALCAQQAAAHEGLYRCLSITKPGSYVARNYGVEQANGDILVFTDSDTKPVPGWLVAVRDNIVPGRILSGRIILDVTQNRVWECFDAVAHMNNEEAASKNSIATANMAVLREDFLSVGPFKEIFSGGDFEWSQRAADSGLTIQFQRDMLVHHPTRKSYAQVRKKEVRIAYGEGNRARVNKESFLPLFARYLLLPIKFDTYMRFGRQIKSYGVSRKEIRIFYHGFFKIRLEQIKFVLSGYFLADARRLDI